MPAHIQDLPVELFLDNLLPVLPLRDLLALAGTNKFFTSLVNDDMFWKLKLESEFNFTSRETARTAGWKAIYRGMRRPQVFTWGQASNGRLGNGKTGYREFAHTPIRPALKPPGGAGIASLAAGGWSFHAIDTKGRLYAWGQMNEHNAHGVDGFLDPGQCAPYPFRLDIPSSTDGGKSQTHFEYVSCGRAHSHAVDSVGNVWLWTSWGAGLKLKSPEMDGMIPDTKIAQVESGWSSGFALTESGAVLAWFPDETQMNRAIYDTRERIDTGDHAQVVEVDGERVVKPFVTDFDFTPLTLPSLPSDLPPLAPVEGPIKLVKIAAAEQFLIGLTNAGHVLKMDIAQARVRFERNTSIAPPPLAQWEYLPKFSSRVEIATHPTFTQDASLLPESLIISHISAHFHTFFAYSTGTSSVVLEGDDGTSATDNAKALPSLQNRGVISVVLGDYHWGALTSDGDFFTWGWFSHGALGLGDPFKRPPGPGGFADEHARAQMNRNWYADSVVPVTEPTKVEFGGGKFVIAATAAGWHTGALVINLGDPTAEDIEVAELHDRALESTRGDEPSQNPSGQPAFPGDPMGIFTSPPFIPRGPGGIPLIPRRGGNGHRLPDHPGHTMPVQPPIGGGGLGRGAFPFRIGFAGRGARLGGPGRATGGGGGGQSEEHEEEQGTGPSGSQQEGSNAGPETS